MLLLSHDRVAAIGHRGGSMLRPENTIPAFDHAVSLGVDGLECDVHCSRDGEVVVIHDPTLERTTSGHGAVKDFTADELARLDAAAHFGPEHGWPYRGQGIGVPTLRAVLARYPSIPVIVEIKGHDPEVADRTLAVIREARAEDRVVIAGFSHVVMTRVRRLAPHLPTSASRPEVQSARFRSLCRLNLRPTGYRAQIVPFRYRGRRILTGAYVRASLRAKIPVHAWIVDRAEDIATVIGWGVTGLISDRPDLAVAAARMANAGRSPA